MKEVASLFAAFDDSAPCGEDLEYSPAFLALQQAAVVRQEQQFGATIIPAEVPDWSVVRRQAVSLCERTCDLRVLALWTQANAELDGLEGYAEGVSLIADVLGDHWDHLFPALRVEGEFDPMPRANALMALADAQGAARPVRVACLLDDVHGQITVRAAEALLDGSHSESDGYPGGRPRLIEALRHASMRNASQVRALPRILEALERIRRIMAERAGPEWAPDFSGLSRTLSLITAALSDAGRAVPGGGASNGDAQGARQGNDKPEHAASAVGGEVGQALADAGAWREIDINTREDAMLVLEKVCRYFEYHEPSHPAPFLIRRVQQTVPLNFHEMLMDLAPQGLDQFAAWMPRRD
jgi:type VI secretion system protein ImpA